MSTGLLEARTVARGSLSVVAAVMSLAVLGACGDSGNGGNQADSAVRSAPPGEARTPLANLGFLGARSRPAAKTFEIADRDDPDRKRTAGGLVLAEIDPGSPLGAIGLGVGDIIVAVAGDPLPVKERPSADLLARIERAYAAGKTEIELQVLRGGRPQAATLRLDPTDLEPLALGSLEASPRVTRAVRRGLSYLIGCQRPDGTFETAGTSPDAVLATTSAAGLALLAGASLDGAHPSTRPRKPQADGDLGAWEQKRRDAVQACLGAVTSAIEDDGITHLGASFATLFLAEYAFARHEPTHLIDLSRALARVLSGQDENGAWPLGTGTPRLGTSERTLATEFALLALGAAERAGVQIENAPFEHAFEAIRHATNDGHPGFVPEPGFDRRTEAARLAGLQAALCCAGCDPLEPMIQAFFTYASQHAGDIADAPIDEALALLGWALTCRQQGLIQWNLFTMDHLVTILGLQKLDGSFCLLPKSRRVELPLFDECQGPAWRTALYCVILALQHDASPLLTARLAAGPETRRSGSGERLDGSSADGGGAADQGIPAGAQMIEVTNIEDAIEMLKKMGFDEDSAEVKQIKELQEKLGKKKDD